MKIKLLLLEADDLKNVHEQFTHTRCESFPINFTAICYERNIKIRNPKLPRIHSKTIYHIIHAFL
jgi:hypothetical protein